MAKRLTDKLEDLLAGPDELPETTRDLGLLRARLRASVSQGLGIEGGIAQGQGDPGDDAARKAAFLEGRLEGAERQAFLAALARDASLRADVGVAAAFLDSVAAGPSAVPTELLAKAGRALAPSAATVLAGTRFWRVRLFGERPRLAWAMVATVCLVAVITPGVVMVLGDRLDSTSQPDSSAAPSYPWAHRLKPARPSATQPEAARQADTCETSSKGNSDDQVAAQQEAMRPPRSAQEDPCSAPSPRSAEPAKSRTSDRP